MRNADDVTELRERLEQLELGSAAIGDWHRFEARAARAMIHVQNEISLIQADLIDFVKAEPPDPRWYQQNSRVARLRETMDELRMLRLVAQGRIFEHEAEQQQSSFSNWAYARRGA